MKNARRFKLTWSEERPPYQEIIRQIVLLPGTMAVAVDNSANRCHIDGENFREKVINKFCTASGILAIRGSSRSSRRDCQLNSFLDANWSAVEPADWDRPKSAGKTSTFAAFPVTHHRAVSDKVQACVRKRFAGI